MSDYLEWFLFPDHATAYLTERIPDVNDSHQLLKILEDSNSKTELILSAITLLNEPFPAGSEAALRRLLENSCSEIRLSALIRIAMILKSEGLSLYLDCLTDKRFSDKENVTILIMKYGDERGIAAVAKRLKNRLKSRKSAPYLRNTGQSEITDMAEYLHKFCETSKDSSETLDFILLQWDRLDKAEAKWILDNLKYFQQKRSNLSL